jgi:predicted GH43/DUF377 family glycosyl hydrolase
MLAACGIEVERLCGGEPIVAPTGEGWESGHTYNAAAVRLGPADAALMAGLLGPGVTPPAEGLVAVFYRAQPRYSPGFRSPRSAIGLALFTPTFAPLRRFSEPVLCPTEDPHGYDYDGVEDPRVTRLGEIFYLVYCGYTLLPSGRSAMQVCLARSRDLLHWEKLGPVRGEVNCSANKDGVLFPEPVNGHYLLLHRPMVGDPSRFAIELAISDSPEGEWRNCGPILRSPGHPRCRVSWVGAGSVPLPLGDGRYLVIYHTGNRLREGGRRCHPQPAPLLPGAAGAYRHAHPRTHSGARNALRAQHAGAHHRSAALRFPLRQLPRGWLPAPRLRRRRCLYPGGARQDGGAAGAPLLRGTAPRLNIQADDAPGAQQPGRRRARTGLPAALPNVQ